jgi:hypothetical protein
MAPLLLRHASALLGTWPGRLLATVSLKKMREECASTRNTLYFSLFQPRLINPPTHSLSLSLLSLSLKAATLASVGIGLLVAFQERLVSVWMT